MKLDVIIPVRNCPARVTRILLSLQRELQYEPRASAIIVDDASTDDTAAVVKDFAERTERVTFTANQTRRNAGGARNKGIYLSTADYVCFFDADDDIEKGALKKICDALEKDSPEMLIWGFLRLSKEGNRVWLPDFKDSIYDFCKSPCAPWIKAVRRDKVIRFDECVYCEDCPWWFRQADCVNPSKVSVIAEPLYIYDRRENCFSNTLSFFASQPHTLEYLAYSDMLVKKGMNDRAPSDCLRNLAALYDLRHELKHPYVKAVWAGRLHNDYTNILSGRWCF